MSDLPGVRNRIYQSPRYGLTLIWERRDWEPSLSFQDGEVDVLVLTDPRGDALNQLEIRIEELPQDASEEQIRDRAFALVSEAFDKKVEDPQGDPKQEPPTREYLSGKGWYWDGGERVEFEVRCPLIPGGINRDEEPVPYLALSTHTFRSGSDRASVGREVMNSIHPPRPDHDVPVTGGVLDVFHARAFLRQDDQLEFELVLRNVDTESADFDVDLLRLNTGTPTNVLVEWEGGATDKQITIHAGEDAAGTVTFWPVEVKLVRISYQQQTGRLGLAATLRIEGASGRPRIDPGR